MDHATLRAAVVDYLNKQLAEAKAHRASLGPYTPEERERVVNTVGMLEAGNSEFWQVAGRDHCGTACKIDPCIGVIGVQK